MADKPKKTGKKKTGKKREKLIIPGRNCACAGVFQQYGNQHHRPGRESTLGLQRRRGGIQRLTQRYSLCRPAGRHDGGERSQRVRPALCTGFPERPGCRPGIGRARASGLGHRGEVHPGHHPDSAQWLQTTEAQASVARCYGNSREHRFRDWGGRFRAAGIAVRRIPG